jgi:hypothetical protein
VIHNLLTKAKRISTKFAWTCNKFCIGWEEVCSLLAFWNLKVIENVVNWNLFVWGVKQVDNYSHDILFNFLLLVKIPEAKLDYIKGSEWFVKSQVFSDVSKVWLEELIKFGQDLVLEHDISKLVLLFFWRIFVGFEKEVTQSLANFFRRIEQSHLFKFKLH